MAGGFPAHPEADAAIVYSDVDPDVTVLIGIFNGDGLVKFRLSQSGIAFSSLVTDKVSMGQIN
jgi:hypothetical protein